MNEASLTQIVASGPSPRATPSDVALLAAIHARALALGPRLDRVLPGQARPGETVLLLGERLAGSVLQVRFGLAATWGLAVSDRAALAVVPPCAAGPVTVVRDGLPSNPLALATPACARPAVLRVEPAHGAVGAWRDAPVVITLSAPVDPLSLDRAAVRVECEGRGVAGRPFASPDRSVVAWLPAAPLAPAAAHVVSVQALRDRQGRRVVPHRSVFRTGGALLGTGQLN